MSAYSTLTRNESYHDITNLGDKQAQVLEVIGSLAPVSDRTIASTLDWPINRVVPRRNELVEKGLVRQEGSEWDRETQRQVALWVTTENAPSSPPVQPLTHQEIRAFARRLVEGDKQASEIGLTGYWKILAREIIAAITDRELDALEDCIAGYNRTGELEKYEQYKVILALVTQQRQEITTRQGAN